MFDEQNKNTNVPNNLPTEPMDMFAGVDKNVVAAPAAESAPDALSSGLLKKKDNTTTMPDLKGMGEEEVNLGNYKMSNPILGKILLFIVIILVVGAVAYGAWWFMYGRKGNASKQTTSQSVQTTSQNNASQTPNSSTSIPNQINNDQILFGQGVDVDKDGLDDVREKEIGTNPQNADTDNDGVNDGDEVIVFKTGPLNADTDNDGLSDGDEVLIWKTNPLNPDTDGDSYPDGTEVKNGYSPLGPGKLFNLPASSTTSSASASASGSSN